MTKMKYRSSNNVYTEDVCLCSQLNLPWEELANSTLCISGATGMIGSFIIDVLMKKNTEEGLNCEIIALGRDLKKAQLRLPYFNERNFRFVQIDINKFHVRIPDANYVLHLASVTHPEAYSLHPIDTITSNVVGIFNMLDAFLRNKNQKRFIFTSSVEIYGENRGDTEKFKEDYCGYINSNTLRAGYPESKRLSESICQAYIKEHGVDALITRLPRVYGGNVLPGDTKVISQFLFNAANKQDIVLKSAGNQKYSFGYVADVVSGILYCLFKGEAGEAYNIADEKSDISLNDLASLIAREAGVDVVKGYPNAIEIKGFSKSTKALMDATKLSQLGWESEFDIRTGIQRSLKILADRVL